MAVPRLNVLTCDLDGTLERPGFRHAGAPIGGRIGAERIGAGLYEAVAGLPIWPYHYHYGTEEWVYVLSGAPVLRDPGGRRGLSPGDLACFPPDHRGAHTLEGPGRFLIFSTRESSGPWMSVYPDSDKVGLMPGPGRDPLRLPRSAAVGYWHGEGAGDSSDPVEVEREPADGGGRPVINALSVPTHDPPSDAAPGSSGRAARPGPALGAARLEPTVLDLDPGEESEPYHYTWGREEWVLSLTGTPTVRHSDGQEALHPGEVVCFPEGPAGAHQLVNLGDSAARVLVLESRGTPAHTCYLDSDTWVLDHGPDRPSVTLRGPAGY